MKTPSKELFRLIKSMSTQEKVQFKLYASRKKSNSAYVQLFDAIDAQKEYDEAVIKTKLKNESLIKNLDSAKTYVTEAILKSLQEYYSKDSIDAQLCEFIQQIEILVGKCLFVQAKKMIHKAEALAVKHHQHPYLLTLLAWKRKAMVAGDINPEDIDKDQHALYLAELHSMKVHQNLTEYRQLYIRGACIVIGQFQKPDEKAIHELNQILQSPWMKDETLAISSPAKVTYYRIMGEVFFLLRNAEKSYGYYQKALEYAEPAQLWINDRINIYSRVMLSLCELRKNEELTLIQHEIVSLLKSLPKKALTIGLLRHFQAVTNNYIDYLLSIGNAAEALIQSDEMWELTKNNLSTQGLMVYYGNRSYIAFFMEDYRQALSYAQKVLALEKAGIREDIVASVKLFILTIHYELGNENMLPNLCKSMSRLIDKKSGGAIEKITLNFFSKTIVSANSKREKIKAFLEFKKALEAVKSENPAVNFDFISWAESKIKNKPFVDIFREKAMGN